MKINDQRRRLLYVAGAVGAGIVATIFLTIGDGVSIPEATGIRGAIVNHGHTLTWVLLVFACASAAIRSTWSQPAKTLAILAGISYVLFLMAVFILP